MTPQDTARDGAAAERDVVLSLAFETFSDTVSRRIFSPDVLVQHLLSSPRVDRLLIADPWRSVLSRLRRRAVATFPTSDTAQLVSPMRLRRQDPSDPTLLDAATDRYLASIVRAAHTAGMTRPALIATHPFVAARARAEDWAHVTYYGWDDWAAHPAFAASRDVYLQAYERMRANGVRVVGVTQRIVDRIGSPGRSRAVPNGLHADEWRLPVEPPEWFATAGRPRFLYTGAIDTRLDLDVVREISQSFPDARIFVVGPHGDSAVVEALGGLANVEVRGWQDRVTTRGLIFHCDVALIPHVTSDLTLAMSPLKLYEYLAAGRPVVASDLPPIRSVGGVFLADGPSQFVDQIRQALARGPMDEPTRQRFVQQNSWDNRLEELLDVAL